MSQPLHHIKTSPKPPARPTSSSSAAASSVSSPPTTWPSAACRSPWSKRDASAPSSRAATGAGAASRTATLANCRWRPGALSCGTVCRRERRRHGLSPLRLAVPQQRRSPDCRLGQLARFREDRRRDHAHAEQPRSLGARPGDRPRVERRRVLAQRRHGRSWQRRRPPWQPRS